jgi:DNA-binding transcriptional LysR family regulator
MLRRVEWGDLAYLLAVARTSSLSAAARQLDVSTSTVARRLTVLERDLGLRLLDRRADGVRLTLHGTRVVALAGAVRDDVASLERTVTTLREGEWSEPVRVTATEFVVSDVLAPALPRLWRRDPRARVDLVVAANVVSLAQREADVAIRMAQPVGESLVARRLPAVRLALYASRTYLAGRSPASLDLARERFLLYDDTYGRIPEVTWLHGAQLSHAARVRTGSTRALLRAAAAGAGIALLPTAFAARDDALVEIPAPHPIPPRTPWLVFHRDLRAARPVRVVRDWAFASFVEALTPARGRRGPGTVPPR